MGLCHGRGTAAIVSGVADSRAFHEILLCPAVLRWDMGPGREGPGGGGSLIRV
jgi:hypothetical protein